MQGGTRDVPDLERRLYRTHDSRRSAGTRTATATITPMMSGESVLLELFELADDGVLDTPADPPKGPVTETVTVVEVTDVVGGGVGEDLEEGAPCVWVPAELPFDSVLVNEAVEGDRHEVSKPAMIWSSSE